VIGFAQQRFHPYETGVAGPSPALPAMRLARQEEVDS
jgi:hypothetical protein